MTLKLTESKLEILVDTLNAIICGEVNITRAARKYGQDGCNPGRVNGTAAPHHCGKRS
jgi:hypothetical protein